MVEILTGSVAQELREGDFFHSLVKKPPHDYDELLTRSEKYINMEEVGQSRPSSIVGKPNFLPNLPLLIISLIVPPCGSQRRGLYIYARTNSYYEG